MNIAIVGYGGMGKMVAQAAQEKGLTISAIIDPVAKEATHKKVDSNALKGVDVAIDFTHPSAVLENIRVYCDTKTNAVVGTTGWYDRLPEVKQMVQKSGIGFLWGSNFSVGVNIYFRIVENAAKLVNKAEQYDVWGFEIHHHNKSDSPSGTAKSLSDILIKNISRKKKAVYEMLNRKIAKDEFHFASVRGGPVNIEHTIGFDSAADCLTLKHAARNRQGYAEGAVLAALWLGKKKGYFELDDFMKGLLGE